MTRPKRRRDGRGNSATKDSSAPPSKRTRVARLKNPTYRSGVDEGKRRDQRHHGLCNDCENLDLQQAFSEADAFFSNNWDITLGLRDWKKAFPFMVGDPGVRAQSLDKVFPGLLVAELGSRFAEAPDLSCSMCRFLWEMRQRAPDQDSTDGRFELRAYPSLWALPFVHLEPCHFPTKSRGPQSSILAVVPADHRQRCRMGFHPQARFVRHAIFRDQTSSPDAISARHVEPMVNLQWLRECISFCVKNHDSPGCPKPKERRQRRRLTGFRLIDCEARQVVEGSLSTNYVALSYVWGVSADTIVNEKWPRVVEDAVAVTQQLGFRYLWVDRYCINQANATQKHEQIAHMHDIYRQAQLTIIAAAGSDAGHGLAGVGRPRETRPQVIFKGQTLLAVPNDPFERIQGTKWWCRGWTYQEGVLSRRRVVFLPDQVYYECGGMTAQESFRLPPGNLHIPSKRYQQAFLRSGVFNNGMSLSSRTRNPFRLAASLQLETRYDRVLGHIRSYSHRELTYEADVLNAFAGILAAHEVPTVVGLVVPPGFSHHRLVSDAVISFPDARQRRDMQDLAWALSSWSHIGIGPHAFRIRTFPSWTWAGWRGFLVITSRAESSPMDISMTVGPEKPRQVFLSEHQSLVGPNLRLTKPPPQGSEQQWGLTLDGYLQVNPLRCRYDVLSNKVRWVTSHKTLGDVLDMRIRFSVEEPAREDNLVVVLTARTTESLFFIVLRHCTSGTTNTEGNRRDPGAGTYCERIGRASLRTTIYWAAMMEAESPPLLLWRNSASKFQRRRL
ncbi:heterokaryon incompatibility protein-domain-containing protein [Echria macrotheca]|uniref:Heterokaryon incompatibility protein-domain-containing protein n=1 Tax=Echria macrotheca TaxID=438768 RepID=A0AAJ0BBL0_9PEZI|nr:heterokaryon incompatibility protein-domain-containing protein [Echria macrotheca]